MGQRFFNFVPSNSTVLIYSCVGGGNGMPRFSSSVCRLKCLWLSTVKRAFWAPRMMDHVSHVWAKMTCRFYFLMVESWDFFFFLKKQWMRLWCGWIFSWNFPLVWADHTYKIIKSPINRLVRVFVNKWFYRSFDANFIENEETYKKISVVVVVVFVLFCFFPYK